MTAKILCIYHRDCADGFASAWAVHRRFGDTVEFVAAKYGEDPQLIESDSDYRERLRKKIPDYVSFNTASGSDLDAAGYGMELARRRPYRDRDVLIVDFSYPRSVLEAMAREARSVLVLDHHATAQEDLAGLGHCDDWDAWQSALRTFTSTYISSVGTPIYLSSRLAAVFDMNRSGAGLTWDYLHPGEPRPCIIDLVEDRDLWRFAHDPDTRRFHAVVASYGYEATAENFANWDAFHTLSTLSTDKSLNLWQDTLNEGGAILRAEAKLVEGIVRDTRRTMRLVGHIVPVACCPGALASEVGNALMKEPTPLTDVGRDQLLMRFHEECPVPTVDQIIEWTGRYPDYAEDIRAHAAVSRDWAARGGLDGDEPTKAELDKAFNRAIDILMSTPKFSATYYDSPKGRHFSLRSLPLGADVSKIAKHYGGGGHRNAAGFLAPLGWEGE